VTIVIDASYFIALLNPKDVHHTTATEMLPKLLNERIITTELIFEETVSVILRKCDKQTAINIGNKILNSEISVHSANVCIFQKAWQSFQKYNKVSFTNCTTIEFMKMFQCSSLVTFDKEFESLENIKVIDK
jgi:uncharacterized protein